MLSHRILASICLVVVALIANPTLAQHAKPKVGPLGMKFVPLPKATFYMGGGSGKAGKKTAGKKTEIQSDFEIAIHTVTQRQWLEVMGSTPSFFSRTGSERNVVKDILDENLWNFPVEGVSWNDAQEFIKNLNETEKAKGYQYRLPSDAEWEYACRGGATSEEECSFDFYFAKPTNDLSSKEANFNGQAPVGKADRGPYLQRPAKVGSYPPNKIGLYDMHGNVGQWCEDRFKNGSEDRVARGGFCGIIGIGCRASNRFTADPSDRNNDLYIGFRLVRVPVPQRAEPKAGPLGMKFVPLPKATFYMGGGGGKAGKKTEITSDFEIAIHTVTQGQWQEVTGNNPSHFSRNGKGKGKVQDIKDEDLKHFPVEMVSWNDAQEFIKKLNEKEKGKGYRYRLPSEAEWEYACRGGATSEEECSYHFYFAKPTNDLSSKEANFNGKPFGYAEKGPYLQRTTKVASYAPNKLGLFDMHGNIQQWCEDLWKKGGTERVYRGSDYGLGDYYCQAGIRYFKGEPSDRGKNLGFRLVRDQKK
ncbi:MAG: formylglycine-generating enzyme family protein [Gemmataceae bacterium]|nr:formylglycine-generating enzyme family protein [Gemmataceae bacterium]